ncbi:MAG TPA: 50S ribosomal protein L29 [Patescibacteria group bacterium]|jgi:ribosomal protein L29|nr:50S ribosomal protein L29 [Patescibacteria group bacterium]
MATAKTTPKTAKPATEVKTATQLEKQLTEKNADLLSAYQSHKAGELANPRVLKSLRRDIARIKTELTSKSKEAK